MNICDLSDDYFYCFIITIKTNRIYDQYHSFTYNDIFFNKHNNQDNECFLYKVDKNYDNGVPRYCLLKETQNLEQDFSHYISSLLTETPHEYYINLLKILKEDYNNMLVCTDMSESTSSSKINIIFNRMKNDDIEDIVHLMEQSKKGLYI